MRPRIFHTINPASFGRAQATLEVLIDDEWKHVYSSSFGHITSRINRARTNSRNNEEYEDVIMRVYDNDTRLIRWEGRLSTFRGLGKLETSDERMIDNMLHPSLGRNNRAY